MKTASGYYTIHWDCPECGIHNECPEKDLGRSDGILIGFCDYCCSSSIVEVENLDSMGIAMMDFAARSPVHIAVKIVELGLYDNEIRECIEQEIVDIPFISPALYETPEKAAIDFRYENWDTEGMLHMKDVHDCQFSLKSGSPSHSLPTLHRRMEKRPYSGNCNLRFN